MIKNRTVYKGRIKTFFEKHPHYTGGGMGVLNKIHLDLGVTKLVSRVMPNGLGDMVPDPDKIDLINKFTGGKIKDHRWLTVKNENTGTIREIKIGIDPEEIKEGEKIISDDTLQDSFIAPDGTYLGNVSDGWWYYKNNFLVCWEYPHGVAIQLKTKASEYPYIESYKTDGIVGSDDIEGYYGYSHRGGSLFRIGDRIFEAEYQPRQKDYSPQQWEQFLIKAKESKRRQVKEGWMKSDEEVPVSDVVQFTLRGKEEIRNWEDCRRAAENLSRYLG